MVVSTEPSHSQGGHPDDVKLEQHCTRSITPQQTLPLTVAPPSMN